MKNKIIIAVFTIYTVDYFYNYNLFRSKKNVYIHVMSIFSIVLKFLVLVARVDIYIQGGIKMMSDIHGMTGTGPVCCSLS